MSAVAPGRIKHLIYEGRTLEGLLTLARLVGYAIEEADAQQHLTAEQLRDLEVWAERTHLRASDNNVRQPPRPAWLTQAPWKGPDDEWGATETPVDCSSIARSAS